MTPYTAWSSAKPGMPCPLCSQFYYPLQQTIVYRLPAHSPMVASHPSTNWLCLCSTISSCKMSHNLMYPVHGRCHCHILRLLLLPLTLDLRYPWCYQEVPYNLHAMHIYLQGMCPGCRNDVLSLLSHSTALFPTNFMPIRPINRSCV